jgi:glutamate carboxypeptidase
MKRFSPKLSAQPIDMQQLLAEARKHESKLLQRLRELVEIESPSSDKATVDHAITTFATYAEQAGGTLKRHKHRVHGDSLEVRFGPSSRVHKPTMLLGHLDTVWDKGTLTGMPFKITVDKIAGPGVLDMKAGVLMGLAAIEILQSLGQLTKPVIVLLHGDEEIGSPSSRKITEAMAKRCSAVYVLEPAQGDVGAYKTARKAVGMYKLTVLGIAAHSGVDFESGHSAILELTRQIEIIRNFTDFSRGITVNPGVIGGGTQSNVIAAEAWALIDVRLARKADMARIDKMFHKLKPFDKACKLTLEGGINRPPMERTPGTVALFRRAKTFASSIGVDLQEASTGGGSDGNFTSALGIATLDGMGAVGAGAHAVHEHLERAHLSPRIALLAAMLT